MGLTTLEQRDSPRQVDLDDVVYPWQYGPGSAGATRSEEEKMETFTVQLFPIAKPEEWRAFMDSISTGERAAAHRQTLRRLGVKSEHVFTQATPAGQVMVLIWEGVDQAKVGDLMMEMIEDPQSEHERYLATEVIPNIHGVDPKAGPPPEVKKVATITP